MASITSAAVSVPTFSGLKAQTKATKVAVKASPVVAIAPRASLQSEALKNVAVAAVAAAASLALTSGAFAASVGMGAAGGALVFEPKVVKVAPGEPIVFTNVAGYPHNVVFDEDEVPAGVDAEAISHEEYFNGKAESWELKLSAPGKYSYYCEPHNAAGMKGVIIVE